MPWQELCFAGKRSPLDLPSLERYDPNKPTPESPKCGRSKPIPPASVLLALLSAPKPTEVPSPWTITAPYPAKYLLGMFQCLGDAADERKTALGTARLFAPALAPLLLATVNTRAALTFGGCRGGTEAGTGCGVAVTLGHGIWTPEQEMSLCGPSGRRADVAPGERSQVPTAC